MIERPKLGELLLQVRAVNETQLEAALVAQRKWGSPLGTTIVRMGFLDEETLVRTLARQLKLPLAWLRGKRVKPEVLSLVPAEWAIKHRCMPLAAHEDAGGLVLFLGMQDPADLSAIDDLSFRAGCSVNPVLVAPSELDDALARHYPGAARSRADQVIDLEDTVESTDEEPDFLILDRDAQLAASGATERFKFVKEPSCAANQGVLAALHELVGELVEMGIIDHEALIERLRSPGKR
jgi:type IV pilus assembly protein PilB